MSQITELSGPRVEPPVGRTPKQLVILCHGYGSNGFDLIGLVPHLQQVLPDAVYVSPNAPEKCVGAPNGYQWFALSTLSQEERLSGTLRAAPTLDHFIDQELDRYGFDEKDLLLVGFSQGTMMSLHVGLRRAKVAAGILGFSGAMTRGENWAEEVTAKPPVMLIHGDQDNVLPLAHMEEAREALGTIGIDVKSHVSQGVAHSIGPDGMQEALRFMGDIFPDR